MKPDGPSDSTVRRLLQQGVRTLLDAGVPDAALDAEWLLADVLQTDRGGLFSRGSDPTTIEQRRRFQDRIETRAQRVPLQHVLGYQEFYGRRFRADARALVPRPETETLVDCVLRLPLPERARVLDLGTGSGCILFTLLAERPDWSGVGVDRSAAALEQARDNAEMLMLGDRFRLLQGDFSEPPATWSRPSQRPAGAGDDRSASGPGTSGNSASEGVEPNHAEWFKRVDLVVSNPPYIRAEELADLQPEVRDHDPKQALIAGETGLEAYRDILTNCRSLLGPGGRLVLELGYGQAAAVRALARHAGWVLVEVTQDLRGVDRVLTVRVPDAGADSEDGNPERPE